MVFRRDDKGGGWHEPPYTEEEEFEFYRSYNAGPWTIYHGPRKPADMRAQEQQPQPKET
jgi:hypothetical protein